MKLASHFSVTHAENLVRYLRGLEVAPNGRPKARRRRLRDNRTAIAAMKRRAMLMVRDHGPNTARGRADLTADVPRRRET